jgi:ferric-dicitrate binding protein FerR (iron transport regulator)
VPVKERLNYLLEQARQQRATLEEYRELRDMIIRDESGSITEEVNAFHAAAWQGAAAALPYDPAYWQAVAREVLEADKVKATPPVRRLYASGIFKWAAAAVFVLLATGAYLWINNHHGKRPSVASRQKMLITPGKDGAVLTLSDGKQVVLDSLGNGVIATENGTQVIFKNGQLAYDAKGVTEPGAVVYNTITTPRGRQFSMMLPDGSKVWLNAVSSLKYPTSFTGGSRKVELTGEAYFEIATDVTAPFIVQNNKMKVEVLGTAFNMMCYSDEPQAKTTVASGAVRVTGQGHIAELHAGKQVIAGNQEWQLVQADLDEVLAWKNGLFQLNSVDIPTVMRQIARWYDVEIVYAGGVAPQNKLVGFLKREKGLDEAIAILEESGVKCTLENRKLIVQ